MEVSLKASAAEVNKDRGVVWSPFLAGKPDKLQLPRRRRL